MALLDTNPKTRPRLRFPEFNDDWAQRKLKTIAHKSSEKNKTTSADMVLTNSAVRGVVPQSDFFNKEIAVQGNLANYYKVRLNDFVYNPRISTSAPVGPFKRNHYGDGVMSPLYTIYRFHNGENLDFFEMYFSSNGWHKYMRSVANYGARHDRMAISSSDLDNLSLPYPTKPEQEKIAKLLKGVNDRLKLQQEKIEQLRKYKNGVMQGIFSQNLHFINESGGKYPAWTETRIGKLFTQRQERFKDGLALLSVTIGSGVTKRTDIQGKDNSSVDKSNYKRVLKGDVVYNSMRMWQGASGVSQYDGVVSPAYTVLIPEEFVDPNFYGYYFKFPQLVRIFQRHSQGLTSDTWNLKYPQISKIKIFAPSYEEQKKIAKYLAQLDTKIHLEEERLRQFINLKDSLMKGMFA